MKPRDVTLHFIAQGSRKALPRYEIGIVEIACDLEASAWPAGNSLSRNVPISAAIVVEPVRAGMNAVFVEGGLEGISRSVGNIARCDTPSIAIAHEGTERRL